MGKRRCHAVLLSLGLRVLCIVVATVASSEAGNDASTEGGDSHRRPTVVADSTEEPQKHIRQLKQPSQADHAGSQPLDETAELHNLSDKLADAERDNLLLSKQLKTLEGHMAKLVGGHAPNVHTQHKQHNGTLFCPLGVVAPSNCNCGNKQLPEGRCGCSCGSDSRCSCPTGGYYNKSFDMVICREGYLPGQKMNGVEMCSEAPHCHVGREIGPHCECKDDAVEGRCGCRCQNINESCSCPHQAHLESRTVTCNAGLSAATGGMACRASWQMAFLVTWGVLLVAAAVLLLYYVGCVVRTAGLIPCISEKATAPEDLTAE